MFDTMTLTKTAGALCGALLVFMLGGWVAQEIYTSGHGGGEQAFLIETDEPDSGADEVEEVDFASLYSAADAASGERVFSRCSACHRLEAGQNGVGPYLHGVVGREVDSVEGFNYSGALEQVVSVWTPEELYKFLENPRSYAPGTSMAFAGLSRSEERVNVIAYMDMTDGEMTEVEGAAVQEEASTEAEAEVETASAEAEAPAEEAVEEAATEEAVEEAATEEAVEEAATEEAVEEAIEEAREEEAAADDAAAEDAVAEEAAIEEAATEDAATEEAATEEAAADAGAEEASGFAALVAAADLSLGERTYNQCRACHVLEAGNNRVGPYLHDVVGREIGVAEGFRFSSAFQALDGVWTYDELSAFLENPRDYAPGNRMSFRGLSDEQERAAVIAYIEAESQ